MSMFSEGFQEDFWYVVNEFLKNHTISELMEVVSMCIESKEMEYLSGEEHQ